MAERVKYARRASDRVTSYALDSEADSTDADEAVHAKKRRPTANKGRGKGKRTRADTDDDDSTAGEASDESNSPKKKTKPRKKRARKSNNGDKKKKKQRGNRGKLETIQMLPLEMLGEIFSHVGPNTLLSLRLVNKQFHAFLSAKSSEPIWKAARVRAGLADIDDFTEMQYAELLFGKTCQGCYGDKVGKIYRDFYLRKNFCKRCRRLKIVNAARLGQEAPDVAALLHPLAVKCVLRTTHSGTRAWSQWHCSRDFANLDDLWYYDRVLRGLDAREDHSDDVAEREPVDDPRHEPPGPARRSNRPSRHNTTKRQSYKEASESEEDDDPRQSFSRRAKEYADARKGLIDRGYQGRPKLLHAQDQAANFLKLERDELNRLKQPVIARVEGGYTYHWRCRDEAKRRLLQDDPSLDPEIFDSDCWSSEVRRFVSGALIDDAEWGRIKIKAHAACARISLKLAAAKLANKQATQVYKLRTRYNELLNSLDETARPFVPLFGDFLLLPTVKELWTSGDDVDDDTWASQVSLIQEELDDYRLELVLHARRQILAATSDPVAAPQDDADSEEVVESLNDDFFQLATSFVCCTFADCPDKQYRRNWWRWRSLSGVEAKPSAWVGPLREVLQHQHRCHSSQWGPVAGMAKASYPPFRVSLPLEVACGTESLLELHQLDDSKAKRRHLDEASRKSSGYEWVNSGLTRRYFSGKDAWWNMLGWIKHEGAKAAKCQLFLEPPDIRLRVIDDTKLVIDVDDTEEDDPDAGSGTTSASSSENGHAARRSSSGEEEDEDPEEGEDSQEEEDEDDDDEQSISDEDDDDY